MKKTLTTVAALVACAGTQLFAQNAKQDVITFNLTQQQQSSVSTSTAANAGNFSNQPRFYKTLTKKLATLDVIHAIAFVLHNNANYYSSKAQLVLVQGELGGFFNLSEELAAVSSTFGDLGPDGTETQYTPDTITSFSSTTVDQGGTFAALDTGRNFQEVPAGFATEGAWPPGHHQPWGQIFIRDGARVGFNATDPLCEDVTFFFTITVEECYDCFYLNSFISDATFTFKANNSGGPPCCSSPSNLLGKGTDRYYMSLSFDNTQNNPYLNVNSAFYVGDPSTGPWPNIRPAGLIGVSSTFPADGLTPDVIPYEDPIRSGVGIAGPFVMRFTLNGIVTYNWNLKFINTSDLFADFVGTASYNSTGYGFVGLICALLTGPVTFNETIVKASTCCLDEAWYDFNWYATGWNRFQDPWEDFSGLSPFGFGSPVNTPVDLSFHFGYDENYAPNKQAPSFSTTIIGPGVTLPPQADTPNSTGDALNPASFIPTEYLPPCDD